MAGKESEFVDCVVCKKDVGKVHQCNICKHYVHVFCGVGLGEEGFGQRVVCFNCEEPKKGL